jgi:hypothetical protein
MPVQAWAAVYASFFNSQLMSCFAMADVFMLPRPTFAPRLARSQVLRKVALEVVVRW